MDAVPYPTYSWSMTTEVQNMSFVWCLKRCCWLHVIHQSYQNVTCTSTNRLGKAKYNIHLIVHGKYQIDLRFFLNGFDRRRCAGYCYL